MQCPPINETPNYKQQSTNAFKQKTHATNEPNQQRKTLPLRPIYFGGIFYILVSGGLSALRAPRRGHKLVENHWKVIKVSLCSLLWKARWNSIKCSVPPTNKNPNYKQQSANAFKQKTHATYEPDPKEKILSSRPIYFGAFCIFQPWGGGLSALRAPRRGHKLIKNH